MGNVNLAFKGCEDITPPCPVEKKAANQFGKDFSLQGNFTIGLVRKQSILGKENKK